MHAPSAEAVQTNEVEITLYALRDRTRIEAAHFQRKRDVFGRRHMREKCELLENHADGTLVRRHGADSFIVDEYFTDARFLETGDEAEKRRLAGAGRPENGQKTALGEIERCRTHGMEAFIDHADIVDRYGSRSVGDYTASSGFGCIHHCFPFQSKYRKVLYEVISMLFHGMMMFYLRISEPESKSGMCVRKW